MRKIISLAAAVCSIFAAGVAQADVILVDDFNTPTSALVVDDSSLANGAGNGILWQTAPITTALPAPNKASTRSIGVELTTDSTGGDHRALIEGIVGGASGRLTFTTTTGDNGNGYVKWTIPAFAINLPASYYFSVIASALGSVGSGTTPNTAMFSFNGLGDLNSANDFITSVAEIGALGTNLAGTPVTFSLSAAEASLMSGGGELTLKVTGGEGWNLRLDQFAIQIPEPTSLALVGLALVGAGFAASRRKV